MSESQQSLFHFMYCFRYSDGFPFLSRPLSLLIAHCFPFLAAQIISDTSLDGKHHPNLSIISFKSISGLTRSTFENVLTQALKDGYSIHVSQNTALMFGNNLRAISNTTSESFPPEKEIDAKRDAGLTTPDDIQRFEYFIPATDQI